MDHYEHRSVQSTVLPAYTLLPKGFALLFDLAQGLVACRALLLELLLVQQQLSHRQPPGLVQHLSRLDTTRYVRFRAPDCRCHRIWFGWLLSKYETAQGAGACRRAAAYIVIADATVTFAASINSEAPPVSRVNSRLIALLSPIATRISTRIAPFSVSPRISPGGISGLRRGLHWTER